MNRVFLFAIALPALAAQCQTPRVGAYPIQPRPTQEKWVVLFDGKTTNGWRGYRTDHVPAGWSAKDGALLRDPAGEHGDISTDGQFGDFELVLEWNVEPSGNSGIMYRSTEDHDYPWETGPEMQVLDNAGHPDGKNEMTSAGSVYAMYAPMKKVANPGGQWNSVRIMAKGKHIEHWLNGVKIVQYDIGSPDWTDRYKKSKFATMPDYAQRPSGHIVLQDHGNLVKYRNIKIRKL